ncbi:MAG TPA: hypothetical protein DEU95_06350 [Chloroflexi bacterium]|jgi:hypothetical protein|nr:hypothetical protein [Chloroflexota bacterium]HCG29357.1 hypothetical protein [Chloroflexota bacterium]
MYCIVKGLRDTAGGGGVIVDLYWYDRDPEDELLTITPVLVDQIILPAMDATHVTAAMLDEALNRRRPEVERMVAPPPAPPAAVKAMFGRARHVDGVGRTRAVSEIRAESAEVARRAESGRGAKIKLETKEKH